ncbi:MAG: ATP-binding cassette domain-containing protein [Porticoccaceae bacterium]|nr:ATP-binding cassette domain-containing protein [Porticoccaceae bacterium]
MILLNDIELLRGGRHLLNSANLRVHPGQKMGLVGANGSGKSSLFLLLQHVLHADRGDMSYPQDWRIASVEQETPNLSQSVLEHTIDGNAEYRQLEETRERAELEGGEALAHWHHDFEAIDGYSTPSRAARLLAGLGFDEPAQARPVASFSGGWRMRVNLARALLQPSELLLLDEPTNHLDLDAIVWLEGWLNRYQGTMLVISHDREFLDNVVSGIAHIERHEINTYQGDYSSFERQRGEQLMQQQNIYEKQQVQRAHLRKFVDRFQYQATKARQAQSRIKALEKLQAVAPVYASNGYSFEFFEPAALSSPLISFDRVKAGYGDTLILDQIALNLQPGSRIGLLGRNGAGKSTLIKLLAGILEPVAGNIEQGRNLCVGYFDQQQLEALDLQATPLLHIQRLAPKHTEQELRDFLGRFGFAGERARAPVGPLSGGEKTRLALALLVWQKPNLLLLDEPTNHLDVDMREALVIALQEFSGAVVVVSHDRHLLRTVVDELYLVQNRKVAPFAGDLDDYQRLQLEGFGDQESSGNFTGEPLAQNTGKDDRQQRKRLEAEFRQQMAPVRKQLQSLEKQIEKQQGIVDQLSAQLADPTLYESDQSTRVSELIRQHGEDKAKLEAMETTWLELTEDLERRASEFERMSA